MTRRPITRREAIRAAGLLTAALAAVLWSGQAPARSGGGIDLPRRIAEAAATGKRFAVVWEQKGCPYCRRMDDQYLSDPRISGWISSHFVLVVLDLHGTRMVTDFDGSRQSESRLGQKYAIHVTPTIQFLPKDPAAVAGRSGPDIESARMPGLLEADDFLSMFQWVAEGQREDFAAFARRRAHPQPALPHPGGGP